MQTNLWKNMANRSKLLNGPVPSAEEDWLNETAKTGNFLAVPILQRQDADIRRIFVKI